jgi:steroid 5-alpha reductase family enzyme
MAELFGLGLVVILVRMTVLWFISLLVRDSSIVDVFWGTGFGLMVWFYHAMTDGNDTRQWLISLMVTLWGVRLAAYIGKRNLGKGEDYRYQQWRAAAGHAWWWRSYFKVFVLQGVILWVVASPLLGAQYYPSANLTVLDVLGVLFWGTGLFFEAVGDYQLARFKADPANKGKVMDKGLWRYTRHPNYFGDALLWWGFWLVAAAAGGWWTIYSPIIMSFLLMRVSGVALLEKKLVETRPEYAEYIRQTNAFFPWFPKKTVKNE